VLGQAAGFAVLSALWPPALLIAASFLASASPRKTLLIYLAGAVTITVALGIVLLVVLHSAGLNHPHQRQPRYGLRLGLGVLLLSASVVIARRRPKPRKAGKKPGLVARLLSRPGPVTAFALGVLIFAPSGAFIAAVETIATAKASVPLIVLALAIVVVIDVMFIWVPLGLYLAAPEATTRHLTTINAWVQAHAQVIIVLVLALAGVLLAADGISGLTS
jgi:hypothetical protein